MGPVNGFTTTPHHRQNRRRERPGSRTRRTITRKSNVQFDCAEGLEYARDTSVPLPSDITRPSPLLRQNFDQSWQRWKAREAEERTLAEMDKMQLEQEQQRLFGGEVDDDELRRMGILYVGEDIAVDSESNTIVCGVPVESSGPMFSIRQGKPRRSRRSTWRSLPLYLSFSDLSNDADIARLLSFSTPPTPTIQHRPLTIQTHTDTLITPQFQISIRHFPVHFAQPIPFFPTLETGQSSPHRTTPLGPSPLSPNQKPGS
ncbi:uncharacterized protein K444DRAFT_439546 [Hyaloscypha bicolor E]|uniref:Uncharacterized protein n=1 Tax=Hyaloscypha bicolor E TaxID=1095630 RepID=A0A2J6T5A8_9HELO|nr:uncharacterized protein K444DRAFT_439546 [Hyaloscypha bicolor E]PMD58206.1 hypothetical protein K444DRAFT_439546 [Hyaloscypha bicolor E]